MQVARCTDPTYSQLFNEDMAKKVVILGQFVCIHEHVGCQINSSLEDRPCNDDSKGTMTGQYGFVKTLRTVDGWW